MHNRSKNAYFSNSLHMQRIIIYIHNSTKASGYEIKNLPKLPCYEYKIMSRISISVLNYPIYEVKIKTLILWLIITGIDTLILTSAVLVFATERKNNVNPCL